MQLTPLWQLLLKNSRIACQAGTAIFYFSNAELKESDWQ